MDYFLCGYLKDKLLRRLTTRELFIEPNVALNQMNNTLNIFFSIISGFVLVPALAVTFPNDEDGDVFHQYIWFQYRMGPHSPPASNDR
ncbi:hypothetical protein NQ318_022871 [Aromia moschata]|uniref:Uncharacterized protein n=1 Tax=Aromia moschata TaxID=1265417 RepID=A0AAV8XIP6_9CUCU|nr:hypothetical protein NQ318_022871 [Aromia moschata]